MFLCSWVPMPLCPPSDFHFQSIFIYFSSALFVSSCWSHCCPRWWQTGGGKDKRTLREAKQGREVSSNPTYQGGPGPVTNSKTPWSRWRYSSLASRTNLQDVPEEVYRWPGAQGHHWDLSPWGEGSAWAEEARKLPWRRLQLVKGEPAEKERRQWTEPQWECCDRCQTGTPEPWACKRWERSHFELDLF